MEPLVQALPRLTEPDHNNHGDNVYKDGDDDGDDDDDDDNRAPGTGTAPAD